MVTVSDLVGVTYPDIPATLTVIINDKFPVGLYVIGGLLLAVIYPSYKIIDNNSKKTRRHNPKDIEKNHKKAMKKIHKSDMKKVKHNQNILKKIRKGSN